MKDKDLLDVLTVTGWAMWLRYVKHNNIKKDEHGNWPEYDVHGFMVVLDITEEDVTAVEKSTEQLELPFENTQEPKIHGIQPGQPDNEAH